MSQQPKEKKHDPTHTHKEATPSILLDTKQAIDLLIEYVEHYHATMQDRLSSFVLHRYYYQRLFETIKEKGKIVSLNESDNTPNWDWELKKGLAFKVRSCKGVVLAFDKPYDVYEVDIVDGYYSVLSYPIFK